MSGGAIHERPALFLLIIEQVLLAARLLARYGLRIRRILLQIVHAAEWFAYSQVSTLRAEVPRTKFLESRAD